jgi:hypothetical protein
MAVDKLWATPELPRKTAGQGMWTSCGELRGRKYRRVAAKCAFGVSHCPLAAMAFGLAVLDHKQKVTPSPDGEGVTVAIYLLIARLGTATM